MKIATSIKITDLSTKWGLVTVLNPDQSIKRQYRISGKEAAAVHVGNGVLPAGSTAEEWNAGLVIVVGRPCDAGDAIVHTDGTLIVNYGIVEKDGRIDVSLMMLQPHEWATVQGVVMVDANVASQLNLAG
jgi:RNA polymerase subunit RPABC4/transcription elongation factor Spt4